MISPVPPAYTIGKASYPRFQKEPIPGPTDYDPHILNTRSSLPAYSFSKSPRERDGNREFPGPGLYTPYESPKSPGYTISKSPRVLSNIRYISPGPADYSYQKLQAKYQYSISKAKRRIHNSSESPGPGYYSPNLDMKLEASPRIRFSNQPRMPIDSFITPAPGQYHLPDIDRKPGFTIPKARPLPKPANSPGPGFYKIPLSTIGIASTKNNN